METGDFLILTSYLDTAHVVSSKHLEDNLSQNSKINTTFEPKYPL